MRNRLKKLPSPKLPASCGIYRIRNTVTGDAYIGATRNIRLRRTQHRSASRGHSHTKTLQRAYDTYGAALVFEALLICASEDLHFYECLATAHLNHALNTKPISARPIWNTVHVRDSIIETFGLNAS